MRALIHGEIDRGNSTEATSPSPYMSIPGEGNERNVNAARLAAPALGLKRPEFYSRSILTALQKITGSSPTFAEINDFLGRGRELPPAIVSLPERSWFLSKQQLKIEVVDPDSDPEKPHHPKEILFGFSHNYSRIIRASLRYDNGSGLEVAGEKDGNIYRSQHAADTLLGVIAADIQNSRNQYLQAVTLQRQDYFARLAEADPQLAQLVKDVIAASNRVFGDTEIFGFVEDMRSTKTANLAFRESFDRIDGSDILQSVLPEDESSRVGYSGDYGSTERPLANGDWYDSYTYSIAARGQPNRTVILRNTKDINGRKEDDHHPNVPASEYDFDGYLKEDEAGKFGHLAERKAVLLWQPQSFGARRSMFDGFPAPTTMVPAQS